MKACPVCHARTFDDAEVCYGCMHRYEDAAACRKAAVCNTAWESDVGVSVPKPAPLSAESPASAILPPQASASQVVSQMRSVQPVSTPVGRHAVILKDADNDDSLHRDRKRTQGICSGASLREDSSCLRQNVGGAGAEQEEGGLAERISFDGVGWAVRIELVGCEACGVRSSVPRGARFSNASEGGLPSLLAENSAHPLPLTIHICPTFDAEGKTRRLLSEGVDTSVSCCAEKDSARQGVEA